MSDRLDSVDLLDGSFRHALGELMDQLNDHQIPLRIFESIRSPARQARLYAQGRDPSGVDYGRTVTRAQPYQSAHQYGLAVDLVFRVGDRWTWDEPESGMWATMTRLARSCGLETLSFERPHVQAPFQSGLLVPGPMDTDAWLAWLASPDARVPRIGVT